MKNWPWARQNRRWKRTSINGIENPSRLYVSSRQLCQRIITRSWAGIKRELMWYFSMRSICVHVTQIWPSLPLSIQAFPNQIKPNKAGNFYHWSFFSFLPFYCLVILGDSSLKSSQVKKKKSDKKDEKWQKETASKRLMEPWKMFIVNSQDGVLCEGPAVWFVLLRAGQGSLWLVCSDHHGCGY
jgi:hypothetical protein